jgi:ABC-type multidrug transport system ATPase subunit
MIRVEKLVQHYGVRPVLKEVDLEARSGELVVILGPNGSGKSTLMRVIGGALEPQAGFVEVDGMRRRGSVESELAIRRRLVFLPDHPWLPTHMTGREFLLAAGQLYDVPFARLMEHVDRLLALFDLIKESDWPIRSYSSGQMKKIAVASALVTDVPILILDEPFSGGMDPSGILALRRVLRQLASQDQATIVVTTPVPELVEELADRIAVLSDGRILAFDTVNGLRQQTGCTGSLAEALERLLHPGAPDKVARYLEGMQQ